MLMHNFINKYLQILLSKLNELTLSSISVDFGIKNVNAIAFMIILRVFDHKIFLKFTQFIKVEQAMFIKQTSINSNNSSLSNAFIINFITL